MKELIAKRIPGGSSDFLMPNELASGILVQFALQPALKEVYTELLRAEGKELLLAPATLACEDEHTNCVGWAKSGECKNNAGQSAEPALTAAIFSLGAPTPNPTSLTLSPEPSPHRARLHESLVPQEL